MILEFAVAHALARLLHSAACATYKSQRYFLYVDTDFTVEDFDVAGAVDSEAILHCRLETWDSYLEARREIGCDGGIFAETLRRRLQQCLQTVDTSRQIVRPPPPSAHTSAHADPPTPVHNCQQVCAASFACGTSAVEVVPLPPPQQLQQLAQQCRQIDPLFDTYDSVDLCFSRPTPHPPSVSPPPKTT
uniref:Protein transport protein SEC31 n=1 Tax=Lygus hesperus TaxID=30085 RepID=A0A0A9YZC1_LYGHE